MARHRAAEKAGIEPRHSEYLISALEPHSRHASTPNTALLETGAKPVDENLGADASMG